MPLRSVKMNRFIFGFQRRVWCPKWTPLSSSWRMVTTAMVVGSLLSLVVTHTGGWASWRLVVGPQADPTRIGTREGPPPPAGSADAERRRCPRALTGGTRGRPHEAVAGTKHTPRRGGA